MKPKTPKPRVMWARQHSIDSEDLVCHEDKQRARLHNDKAERVTLIRHSDIEALVELAAKAMFAHQYIGYDFETHEIAGLYRARARAALTSAGIPCKQRRARK